MRKQRRRKDHLEGNLHLLVRTKGQICFTLLLFVSVGVFVTGLGRISTS